MKIAIMQPAFIPWAGYFGLIKYVDKFVFWMMFSLKEDLGNKEIRFMKKMILHLLLFR